MSGKLWQKLARRRANEEDEQTKSELARVLGLFDLIALGVGATLGLGVYILAGKVAKESAGPGVCISFLIAAFASTLAGMCYAEFASRVPKAGSAYIYSYVTVGEFIAFVIGWNLILEYVIGTASVARGLSEYVDAMMNHTMRNYLHSLMPINVSYLADYPDFFAFGVIILLSLLLCIGARESSNLNIVFTFVNLTTIVIVIVAGFINAKPSYWNISPGDPGFPAEGGGSGGFFPFGIRGVMAGAATCFYGFVGFDVVASTGEEAKNPQKSIPIAIVVSLFIIFIAYFLISTVLTMMLPYYAQNENSPFPHAFEAVGWPTVKWIVNIGAIFALCTSLIGAIFPLPRILYVMGADGVIFKSFSKINRRTQTPVVGTIISGSLTGLMTLLFDLKQLIDMMSIGTLLAYTIVAVSVIILRYEKTSQSIKKPVNTIGINSERSLLNFFTRVFNMNNQKLTTTFTSNVASWGVVVFAVAILVFGIVLNFTEFSGQSKYLFNYVLLCIFGILLVLCVVAIGRQPAERLDLSFKVPFVPLVPCLSIFINLLLMLQLDLSTWIRFIIWMLIGFGIYFLYGIKHSAQGQRDKLSQTYDSSKL